MKETDRETASAKRMIEVGTVCRDSIELVIVRPILAQTDRTFKQNKSQTTYPGRQHMKETLIGRYQGSRTVTCHNTGPRWPDEIYYFCSPPPVSIKTAPIANAHQYL
jgi:hypothetical protein